MAEIAIQPMTFEEFVALGAEGRYELVAGRREELVSPGLKHGGTIIRLGRMLDAFLEEYDPEGFWGNEFDIPTLPYFGRRPDVAYYSAAAAAASLDIDAERIRGVPTLVVEVVSPDDEKRDLVTKRHEYARVGIKQYWILHPKRRTATILVLQDGEYAVERDFSGDETLTASLFPGLEIPLRRIFR